MGFGRLLRELSVDQGPLAAPRHHRIAALSVRRSCRGLRSTPRVDAGTTPFGVEAADADEPDMQ
jgi:hypothetical protein